MKSIIKSRLFLPSLIMLSAAALYFLLDFILFKWIFFAEYHPNVCTGASSSEAISKYCNLVNSKKERLAKADLKDIIVTITFSKPLNEAEYQNYVKAYNIRVNSYNLRGIQPDATRTSGGAWFNWTGVGSSEERHNSKLVGAVSLDGYIDSKNLIAAISDPCSYLVDTSRDGYWGGLFRSRGEARNNWTKGLSPGKIFNRDLAWQLEEHGIAGYSYYPAHLENSGYAIMSGA